MRIKINTHIYLVDCWPYFTVQLFTVYISLTLLVFIHWVGYAIFLNEFEILGKFY